MELFKKVNVENGFNEKKLNDLKVKVSEVDKLEGYQEEKVFEEVLVEGPGVIMKKYVKK